MGSIAELKADPKNARKHSRRNIDMLVDSLQEVGAARSIVIDEDDTILAGTCDNCNYGDLRGYFVGIPVYYCLHPIFCRTRARRIPDPQQRLPGCTDFWKPKPDSEEAAVEQAQPA